MEMEVNSFGQLLNRDKAGPQPKMEAWKILC